MKHLIHLWQNSCFSFHSAYTNQLKAKSAECYHILLELWAEFTVDKVELHITSKDNDFITPENTL